MSTKIYNGFRFAQTDLQEVFQSLHALRPIAKDKAQHMAGEALVRMAIGHYDRQCAGLSNSSKNALSLAWTDWREHQERARKSERTTHDYELSVTIVPHPKKGWLGLYYAENKDMAELVTHSSWYKEYVYWNNTDQPDELTDKQWEQRGRDWDKALGHNSPVLSGLSVQISLYMSPVLENLPQPEKIEHLSFKRRTHDIVTDMAVTYLSENSPTWRAKLKDSNHHVSSFMERELRKGDKCEDPEIKSAWVACSEKASRLLVETPTLEMLGKQHVLAVEEAEASSKAKPRKP